MAKILLNFPLCVSAKREKCSIRHGAKIYRWHYWGIYQAIQQARVFEIYQKCQNSFSMPPGTVKLTKSLNLPKISEGAFSMPR